MQRTALTTLKTAAVLIGTVAAFYALPVQAQTAPPLTLEGPAQVAPADPLPAWLGYQDPYNKKNADLSQAHLSNSDIEEWAQAHVTDALTLAAKDANAKITTLRPLFTEAGWASYSQALGQLKSADILRTQQRDITTIANGEATVTSGSAQGAHYRWQVTLPVMQSYTAATAAPVQSSGQITLNVGIIRATTATADKAGEQPQHTDLRIDSIVVTGIAAAR